MILCDMIRLVKFLQAKSVLLDVGKLPQNYIPQEPFHYTKYVGGFAWLRAAAWFFLGKGEGQNVAEDRQSWAGRGQEIDGVV